MDTSQYSLPGVLRFLQTEWHKNARDRMQWDMERTEMRTRILKLEGDAGTLQRAAELHEKTAMLLEERLRDIQSPGANGHLKQKQKDHEANAAAGAEREASEALKRDINQMQQTSAHLNECLAEVRQLLEQSPATREDLLYLGASSDAVGAPAGESRNILIRQAADKLSGPADMMVGTLADPATLVTCACGVAGPLCVVGTRDGRLLVWNVTEQALVCTVQCTGSVHAVIYNPLFSEVYASIGGGADPICVYGLRDSQLEFTRKLEGLDAQAEPCGPATLLALASDRRAIACGSSGGVFMLETSGRARWRTSASGVQALLFHSDGLVVGSADGSLVLLDQRTGALSKRLRPAGQSSLLAVTALAPANHVSESAIMVGTAGGAILVYDTSDNSELHKVETAHVGPVTHLCAKSKGGILLSGGRDGRALVWSLGLASLRHKCRLLQHDPLEGGILCATWVGSTVVVGGGDRIVRAYTVE